MQNTNENNINEYAIKTIECKAQSLIGRHGFTRSDYDDLVQDLTLDLLQNLPGFDPDKSSYATFVSRVTDWKIQHILRHRLRAAGDLRREEYSIDDLDPDKPGFELPKELEVESAERLIDLKEGLHAAIAMLPPCLQHFVELLSDNSPEDCATLLGWSRKKLYSSLREVRESFKVRGLNEYLSFFGNSKRAKSLRTRNL